MTVGRCFPQGRGTGLPCTSQVGILRKEEQNYLAVRFGSWKVAAFSGHVVASSVQGTHLLLYQLRAQLEMPFTVMSSALLMLLNT